MEYENDITSFKRKPVDPDLEIQEDIESSAEGSEMEMVSVENKPMEKETDSEGKQPIGDELMMKNMI